MKNVFLDAIFLVLFYTSITVFYWKNKYSKVLNGDVHGRLRDPVVGRPGD